MRYRPHLAVAAAVTSIALLSGCGPKAPDYHSILPPPTTTTSEPNKPQSIADYLQSIGVSGEPVAPNRLTDLNVSIPTPPGWAPYENTNLSPGTRVIAKGSTYPTAMLMVFTLNGNFDPAEVIKHGYADAELSQNFKRLNASTNNYRGFPSSMIEGSYDLNNARMQSYNRIVIATGTPPRAQAGKPPAPPQRYLVQLTITAFAEEAQADGPDVEAIIRGFVVKPK